MLAIDLLTTLPVKCISHLWTCQRKGHKHLSSANIFDIWIMLILEMIKYHFFGFILSLVTDQCGQSALVQNLTFRMQLTGIHVWTMVG
jgi:hypothetical protein